MSSPDVLVDVALSTVISSQPRLTPSDAAARLLPPVGDIAQSMSQLISRQPNTTLPLCDPLIPYLNGDTAAECSHFDAAGRSTSARYVEAILSLLRADRQIASSQPSYLRIVLQARALAQDALAVPGSSRGLFSQSTRPAQLSLAIREAEGALSYALASLDEVPTAWHTLTVQALKSGTPADNYDLLQELLLALKAEITLEGNDVSARAFRDVLSSHFRQCGAGEKEAEIWLNYAMTLLERSKLASTTFVDDVTRSGTFTAHSSQYQAIPVGIESFGDGSKPTCQCPHRDPSKASEQSWYTRDPSANCLRPTTRRSGSLPSATTRHVCAPTSRIVAHFRRCR